MDARNRTTPVRVIWLTHSESPPHDLITATDHRGLTARHARSACEVVQCLLQHWVEDVITVGHPDPHRRDELQRVLEVYFPGVRIHHWQQHGESANSPSASASAASAGGPFIGQAGGPMREPTQSVTREELDMLFGTDADDDTDLSPETPRTDAGSPARNGAGPGSGDVNFGWGAQPA